MSAMRSSVTLKHLLRSWAATRPKVFYSIQSALGRHKDLIVTKNTNIVIEGYPRSANTFAVVAFKKSQIKPVRIAHHLHVPAQVMRAADWGIPSLVLIRKPMDAITSLILRHPGLDAERCVNDYISFYSSLRDYSAMFVVGRFDEVINDYAQTIRRFNEKFGTSYKEFAGDTEAVFKEIELIHKAAKRSDNQIAKPTREKDEKKAIIRERLANPTVASILTAADAVYSDYISL